MDALLYPISHEKIGVPGPPVVAVGGEQNLFPIRTEHGESIKALITADLCQPISLQVDEVHVEGESSFVLMVGTEDDVLTIGCEVRCPIGLTQAGNLFLIFSIRVSNKNLHVIGSYHALC